MKKCVCGKYVRDRVARCPDCGSEKFLFELEQQVACTSCGENNPSHCSSCLNCGSAL